MMHKYPDSDTLYPTRPLRLETVGVTNKNKTLFWCNSIQDKGTNFLDKKTIVTSKTAIVNKMLRRLKLDWNSLIEYLEWGSLLHLHILTQVS